MSAKTNKNQSIATKKFNLFPKKELPTIALIPARCCHTASSINDITGTVSKIIGWNSKVHWGLSMMRYFSRGEVSYIILSGGKTSKCFLPGSDFTKQIFTGELSGVDVAEVLRKGVLSSESFKNRLWKQCYHKTIIRTGITCKKYFLWKSIGFGMSLN